jgi:hypothetical protein
MVRVSSEAGIVVPVWLFDPLFGEKLRHTAFWSPLSTCNITDKGLSLESLVKSHMRELQDITATIFMEVATSCATSPSTFWIQSSKPSRLRLTALALQICKPFE